MKIERLFIYCLLATTCLFTACDNEVTADGDGVYTPLPEGMYPLALTATQGDGSTPKTRVAEFDNITTQWTANQDCIGVRIGDNGTVGQYLITSADGSSMTAEAQVYWQNTGYEYIYGWYPASTDGLPKSGSNINLIDQSTQTNYLRFDFMSAKTTSKINYKSTSIPLPFQHEMVKVNITLKTDNGLNLTDAKVYILGYTACTFNQGIVTGQGDKGYIRTFYDVSTKSYKALIVEESLAAADNFLKIVLKDGKTTYYYRTAVTLTKGNVHNYNITVNFAPVDGKFTINADDNVTIKDYNGTEPIVVNGDATITINNVQLKTTDNVMTINNGATVTLNIEGTNNEFTSTGGAGIKIIESFNYNPRGSITVNGTGASSSKLKITANSGAAIGFRMTGERMEPVIFYYGNIAINKIALDVTGGKESPAIGISALEFDTYDKPKEYGDISINESTINATSTGGAACIGTPFHSNSSSFSMGTISIKNSTITASAGNSDYGDKPACIGFGYTAYNEQGSKKVIRKIEFENTTLKLTTNSAQKVGFGDNGDDSRILTEGIWKDGVKVGTTSWTP